MIFCTVWKSLDECRAFLRAVWSWMDFPRSESLLHSKRGFLKSKMKALKRSLGFLSGRKRLRRSCHCDPVFRRALRLRCDQKKFLHGRWLTRVRVPAAKLWRLLMRSAVAVGFMLTIFRRENFAHSGAALSFWE